MYICIVNYLKQLLQIAVNGVVLISNTKWNSSHDVNHAAITPNSLMAKYHVRLCDDLGSIPNLGTKVLEEWTELD